MDATLGLEDLRPQVLAQALQQISSREYKFTECCVICLGDLTEQCEAWPCRHNDFDFICLVTWLEQRNTCPLCKSTVEEVRYEFGANSGQGKTYKVPEAKIHHAQTDQSLRHGSPSRHVLSHETGIITRRRFVYQRNLHPLHVGSNEWQRIELRFREVTPQLFQTDSKLMSRAKEFLRRELLVFRFLISSDTESVLETRPEQRLSNPEYVLEYIIAILKHIDIQEFTGQAEDMIRNFLGRKNTRILLHELKAWLRSPYGSLRAWDYNVQYHDSTALPSLAPDTAPERTEISIIALKYYEPDAARKPPSAQAWRLYVFKGEEILEVIELSKRSVWLFGREERVVDIITAHPTCSGQHAVLQFRALPKNHQQSQNSDSSEAIIQNRVNLYLMDLNSTQGTVLNGSRIESRCFVKIRHKDVITFGGSTREYVVILPPG